MAYDHGPSHNPVQCEDKVYIPCSRGNYNHGYLMEFYIPITNSYSTVKVPASFGCTTVLKGYLYAIYEDFTQDRGIYRYDPEKNYLDKLNAQPTPRHQTCFVSDEQYLYTIGGSSDGGCLSSTERFDPSANKWEEVAPINLARCSAFGAFMNGKVYIAGGHWRTDTYSSCEVYSPCTNEWHFIASLKEPRRHASMVHHDGSLYVLGGFKHARQSEPGVLSVEVFHSEQNEWKKKTVIPTDCINISEEKDKLHMEKITFKACFVRLSKGVINELKPLNTQQSCSASL